MATPPLASDLFDDANKWIAHCPDYPALLIQYGGGAATDAAVTRGGYAALGNRSPTMLCLTYANNPDHIEDSLAAAKLLTDPNVDQLLQDAERRMKDQMDEALGKEWHEKGLLNLPSCEVKTTNGTAIGHVLWCYNLMKAFGMYEFASKRYTNLKICPWNSKKSFEENAKKL